MNRNLYVVPLLAMGLTGQGVASAGVVTQTIDVSVTVESACEIATSAIDFGAYAGDQLTAPGQITVVCNTGVPYSVALDAGLNFDGTSRTLVDSGGNAIPYSLSYAVTNEAWGDTNVGNTIEGTVVSATGTGGPETFGVEGMVYSTTATLTGGVYTDTVTVTVSF